LAFLRGEFERASARSRVIAADFDLDGITTHPASATSACDPFICS